MKIAINFVLCVLVVLTSSSPTKGQNSPSPPILTPVALPSEIGTSASPILLLDARDDTPNPEHNPANQTSAVQSEGDGVVQSETVTDAGNQSEVMTVTTRVTTSQHTAVAHTVNAFSPSHPTTASLSAAPETPSSSSPTVKRSTPPEEVSTPGGTTVLAGDPYTTSAPPSTSPSQDTTVPQPSTQPSTEALTPASTQPLTPTQPPTTSHPQTSTASNAPAVPSHQEVPSELNVGDDDFKVPHHRPSSPLDPLLAGLVSVFIVTTAIISVVLFLKFRQRTDHPEFHRLQDLPMDDLMEDTPLSRYTY